MSISNNILAAFNAGISTKEEDLLVLKEMSENKYFSDMIDLLDSVDAIDGIEDLRNEFNEFDNKISDFKDYNINIK